MYLVTVIVCLISLHFCNSQVPSSPYGDPRNICPQSNGKSYQVSGYTGTPYIVKPFQNTFVNPGILPPTSKTCRTDGHCIFSYSINITDTRVRPFDQSLPSCASKPGTKVLTYNNRIPGPTFLVPAGHESIVRFHNQIGVLFPESFNPCVGGRSGRPISVHHHGSSSLPPYDGWADDETCYNEIKEYVYPNNRPATNWYHDHALHVTADNAYLGLAGFHLVDSKKKNGGCGEPWNLEDIEEKHLMIQDRLLNSECQLYIDHSGVHKESFYGDINTLSGIPFPLMPLEPKWYRFRLVNAAVSRPFLIKIKNSALNDISQNICKVIVTDGGFREDPVPFPADGLLIGIAERYDIVCDFRALPSTTLYLWNAQNTVLMKDVPYFCYSHLLAKLQVSSTANSQAPLFREDIPTETPEAPVRRVFNKTDYATALDMANRKEYHRKMEFGKSNGQWTINGETWTTFKIAAADVGQNTWELWLFRTGGGWFHPIHMHLVDFYIVKREGDTTLRSYEYMSPKDTFYLGPGDDVWVVARFGAHKGDYMFHCHNLVHEDNDMLRAMHIVDSENGLTASTAQQFIYNGFQNVIYSNWKYADPMLTETAAKPANQMQTYDAAYIKGVLDSNLYRIFYPVPSDEALNGFSNPWKSRWCPV